MWPLHTLFFNETSMKLNYLLIPFVAMTLLSCAAAPQFDPASVEDAAGQVKRVEPLSWWVGMTTLCS